MSDSIEHEHIWNPETGYCRICGCDAVASYYVRCADGARRHPEMFATRREADHWAEWGHICTAGHRVEAVNA